MPPAGVRALAPRTKRREQFLALVAQGLSYSSAATKVGVNPRTVRKEFEHDPSFRAQAIEMAERAVDLVEDVAFKLTQGELVEPVFQGGKQVGHRAIYSERMIELILKSRRGGIYQSRQALEHTGPDGGPVEVKITSEEAKRVSERLVRAGVLRTGSAAALDTLHSPSAN